MTERFVQGDLAGTRGGNGLGLAIAERILALHDSRLQIERLPGGGTAISFSLAAFDVCDDARSV